MQAYDTDDLASSSEDEKRLEKAEKEAERRAAKKRHAGGGNSRHRTNNWSYVPGPSNRNDGPAGMIQPSRPPAAPVLPRSKVIRLYYRCAGWGHLAGKGKGVDGSLDCSTELKGKTVKGVNACKANDNNPESFDVDFMADVYSTGCDPEDAQCSIETTSKILGAIVN